MAKTNLGSVRTGVLDLNDLVDLEDTFGQLDEVNFGRMAVVRRVLWLVKRHADPAVTIEEVGSRFTAETMQEEVRKTLIDAGLIGEDAEGNEQPASAG